MEGLSSKSAIADAAAKVKIVGVDDTFKEDSEPNALKSLERRNIRQDYQTMKRDYMIDFSKYNKRMKPDAASNTLRISKSSSTEILRDLPFKQQLKGITKGASLSIATSPEEDVFGLHGVHFDKTDSSDNNPSSETLSSRLNVSESISSTKKSSMITTIKSDTVEQLMKKSVLGKDLDKCTAAPKLYDSSFAKSKERKREAEETAGPGWFNLPKTEITPQVKKDLQILKMRNSLDPKQHYKRNDSKTLPKYFQMGTIVHNSLDFHSSRATKKQKKSTIVGELLADAEFRRKNKNKFLEIQKSHAVSGKKKFKKKKAKK